MRPNVDKSIYKEDYADYNIKEKIGAMLINIIIIIIIIPIINIIYENYNNKKQRS